MIGGYSESIISALSLTETPPQAPVPPAEHGLEDEGLQPGEHAGARLEADLVDHARPAAGQRDKLTVVVPGACRGHRRALAEALALLEHRQPDVVVVDGQHAEGQDPRAPEVPDMQRVDVEPARHGHAHPRPELVVDALDARDARPDLVRACGETRAHAEPVHGPESSPCQVTFASSRRRHRRAWRGWRAKGMLVARSSPTAAPGAARARRTR